MIQTKGKEPNAVNTSESEKKTNSTIVFTTLLIGLNIKFYEILA